MKRFGIAIVVLIAGVLLGFFAGHLGRGQAGENPDNPPFAPDLTKLSRVEREITRLREAAAAVDRRERELEDALVAMEKMESRSASVLDYRERLFQRLMGSLKEFNGSSVYNLGVYHLYEPYILEAFGRDARIHMLEIGPGINLGTGLIFVMRGAKKYYGLDIYKDPDLYRAAQYENIVKLMQEVAPDQIKNPPESFMEVVDGQVAFKSDRLEYLYPRQSYDIPLPDGSLDFVFSNVTLEHVADPKRTLQAIHRVLRKGGLTVHRVDLRDHRDFSKPLEFLKIPSGTWKEMYADPSKVPTYLNRWRASDFKAALEECGFQVVTLDGLGSPHAYPVSEEMRRSFQPEFQQKSLEDLSVIDLLIVAKKR